MDICIRAHCNSRHGAGKVLSPPPHEALVLDLLLAAGTRCITAVDKPSMHFPRPCYDYTPPLACLTALYCPARHIVKTSYVYSVMCMGRTTCGTAG